MLHTASQHNRYEGVLRAVSTTRSPGSDPLSREGGRGARDQRRRLGEGEPAVVGAQPDPVRITLGGADEHAGDGVWHARRGRLGFGTGGLRLARVDVLNDAVRKLCRHGVVELAALAQLTDRGHGVEVGEQPLVTVVRRAAGGIRPATRTPRAQCRCCR